MDAIIFDNSGKPALLLPVNPVTMAVVDLGRKDVPAGCQFWIVRTEELPDAPIETWEFDKSDMGEPDGIGGTYKMEESDD